MLVAPTLDDLLDFHVQFERIHPFQDGNSRAIPNCRSCYAATMMR